MKLFLCTLFFPSALFAEALVDSFSSAVSADQILLPMFLATVAGFVTALSPCVYPLIPITLSVLGARKYESRVYGFLVALSYTVGMAAIYSILGIIFASFGFLTGSFMQHPVVLLFIAGIFFLMSLSMLGFLNIAIPQKLLTKISSFGGQGVKGAFLMGLVAGVLAAPCTGPVLGAILTIVAQQRDILWGLSLMLCFSLGMGIPFLILGTFSSLLLHIPKSGTWMDKVKLILGALMMGAALFYIGQAWPSFRFGQSSWWLAIFLVGILIISLGFFKNYLARIQLILGTILIAVSVSAMLAYEEAPEQKVVGNLFWHVINEKTSDQKTLDRMIEEAQKNNQPILMDFYADWCKACKELEAKTFHDERVHEKLKEFYLIRIDSTKSSSYLSSLQARFGVLGLPTVVLMNKSKHEKLVGFIEAKEFLPVVSDLSKQ